MLRMFLSWLWLTVLACPCWALDPAGEAFFARLLALDGRTFTGTTVFPTDPAHEMVGKPLHLRVQVLSPSEIHVPFGVGDDASRTWILRRSPEGLILKHQHLLADGSPDPITNYGGTAVPRLLSLMQAFPADAETAAMLPEAASNVWALAFSPDGRTLTYTLERDQRPRYQARFELTADNP
ncbi:MAG: hypothetical protein HY319_12280 [Armatimonadetes bacterium]|nr:hypothetical protein [Armatimonadota bacterium]